MKELHMMGCTDLVIDWWSDCWSDMLAACISNQQAELITDCATDQLTDRQTQMDLTLFVVVLGPMTTFYRLIQVLELS